MSVGSQIEFLIWMLIAASAIALAAARLRIPYTVALVLGGVALGSFHLPLVNGVFAHSPDWLTPNVSLVIFLPALLFEGSLKIQFRQLRENVVPISLLATVGVFTATVISGFVLHWALDIPILVALVFGSIVAATDPISVLSIFKGMSIDKRLAINVEGESLFNDGTSVVLYGILVGAVASSQFNVLTGIRSFAVEVVGGVAFGAGLGYLFSRLTQRIDDPQIEITLTTILAYGSYLIAQSLHLSGVIATVVAGLMIGNFGMRTGMSWRTRISLWSFWEYASFLINSVLFLLIGLQVHLGELMHIWQAAAFSIAAVFVGRVVAVYGLVPISNLFAPRIPLRWQHVMVWGGMRGALSLALVLSLGNAFPYRDQLLNLTFAVVAFTIVAQGITLKPLIRLLRIAKSADDDYSRSRVRQVAVASAIAELDGIASRQLISRPVHDQLLNELKERLEDANSAIDSILGDSRDRLADEFRMARARLSSAEKGAIEQAMNDGWVSSNTASKLIEEVDESLKGPAPESEASNVTD